MSSQGCLACQQGGPVDIEIRIPQPAVLPPPPVRCDLAPTSVLSPTLPSLQTISGKKAFPCRNVGGKKSQDHGSPSHPQGLPAMQCEPISPYTTSLFLQEKGSLMAASICHRMCSASHVCQTALRTGERSLEPHRMHLVLML